MRPTFPLPYTIASPGAVPPPASSSPLRSRRNWTNWISLPGFLNPRVASADLANLLAVRRRCLVPAGPGIAGMYSGGKSSGQQMPGDRSASAPAVTSQVVVLAGDQRFFDRGRGAPLRARRSRSGDLFVLIAWAATFGGLLYLFVVKGFHDPHHAKVHTPSYVGFLMAYLLTSFWFGYVTCARMGLRGPKSLFLSVGSDFGAFLMIISLMFWLVFIVLWAWVGLVSTPIEVALCVRRVSQPVSIPQPEPGA
jgi:hypothetical protein